MPNTHDNTTAHYLHGTHPEEQDRLGLMNRLLNQNSLAEMKLQPGERVLDVGCGLGQLTREMARQVTPAKWATRTASYQDGVSLHDSAALVVGIERSSEQLTVAKQLAHEAGEATLVDFRQGPADQLPLAADEYGTFDVAHARFLLEHVPDPVAVVREMVRALRPGGRIILEDDPHDTLRLWPEPPGFTQLWAAYMRTYDRVGNDPVIGHRLVQILVEAGAEPVRNAWPFFGACAGQPELLLGFVDNAVRILEGVREPILALGQHDEASFAACLQVLRQWALRPDAAFWYAVSWAEGRRPTTSDATR